jgi:hypothetical protein
MEQEVAEPRHRRARIIRSRTVAGMNPTAPDYIDPIFGWRVWLVVGTNRSLRLRSVAFECAWVPRSAFEAQCEGTRAAASFYRRCKRHEPLSLECECGIYATKEIAAAAGYLSTYEDLVGSIATHRVIGRVALWGSIVEGDSGWRASRAYPAHLYVPPSRPDGTPVDAGAVARALEGYGVPVEVLQATVHAHLVTELDAVGQWWPA